MTRNETKPSIAAVKELMGANHDKLREIVQDLLQEMLEGEMTEALGAGKSERSDGRIGYRSGHYNRTLITRVGKLELRVPQDRDGRFSTELFERYQRSEQALVAALAEMYVQGVSTRKVKAITEELCGHSFSASTISAINKRLDDSLTAFARRRLEEPFAYLIIDAKYEKVRQAGVVRSCAVLVALGIDWEARSDLAAWLRKWSPRYPKLTGWAEETIEETFTFYRLPRQHHKHMKSTNMLERFNEEIKRRTIVLRIFPNEDSCLRLIRALAVETHENWLEANRYLNMNDLKEMKKADLRQAA